MTDEAQSSMTAVTAKHRPSWAMPCIALAVGLLLFGAGFGVLFGRYDRYKVGSEAMTHTFARGEQILVGPVADGEPKRGDIVAFDRSAWAGETVGIVVWRVAGVGGDRVSCCDDQGRIQVNGRAVTEEYLRIDQAEAEVGSPASTPFEATVPEGNAFVLGDWRGNAADSRMHLFKGQNSGAVPVNQLDGRVVARFTLFGGATPIQPTSAFTDAGLTGSSTSDNLPVYAWWGTVVGLIVSVLAFVLVVIVGSLRAVRPRS